MTESRSLIFALTVEQFAKWVHDAIEHTDRDGVGAVAVIAGADGLAVMPFADMPALEKSLGIGAARQ
jgi:hypothetical protein